MTPEQALDAIKAHTDPERAAGAKAYHKADRVYLGVANPVLNDLTKTWRQTLNIAERMNLARGLWATDIFEARLAAAKVLTQARIKPDIEVWDLINSWVPDFDSWAIADHACMAGQKRLVADPTRLDDVENWITSEQMWTRRAALVITLPWTKQNFPKPEEIMARDRILEWAAHCVSDRRWVIQKAIAWWIRDLSKHDAQRAQGFLENYGCSMKPFAVKEAAKYLKTP